MAGTSVLSRPERPAVGEVRSRPSKRGYWIGATIAIVGFLVAATWGTVAVMRLYDRVDAFPRAEVPGSVAVQLESGAGQVIYYEQPSDTRIPTLVDLELAVTGPTGEAVAVDRYGADLRYDLPGGDEVVGRAMATFEPTVTGTYEVTAAGAPRIPGAIAVGASFATSVVGTIVGAIALLMVTGLAGLTIVIVTAVRRSRSASV